MRVRRGTPEVSLAVCFCTTPIRTAAICLAFDKCAFADIGLLRLFELEDRSYLFWRGPGCEFTGQSRDQRQG